MSELAFLKELGWWGGFLFILLALSLRLFWGIQKDEGRGRWIAWLRHDRFSRRYRELLDAGLNRLDHWLSPEYPQGPTDHQHHRKTERDRAWSHRLFDLCLLLAVAYPVLSVLLDWAVTGDAASIGGVQVIADVPESWLRWLPIALLILAALSVSFTRRFEGAAAAAAAGAIAGAFAVAIAVAVALVIVEANVAFEVAVIVAAAGAFSGALAVAVAGAITGVAIVSAASPAPSAVGLVFAFAFAAAGAFAQYWLGRRFRAQRLTLLVWSGLIFAALLTLLTTVSWPASTIDHSATTPLLFLGVLPILNAWADFASVGLTRWRLRHGVQGHLVGNAVIDGVAAIAILLLLALAVVGTVHLVHATSGAEFVDLTAHFADLRQSPDRYWWLGFMLFSTLLPTLIHLCIGAFALFTLIPGWVRRPIAAGLQKGDSPEGRAAALALTFAAALAVWVPCFLLWHALTLGGGWLLDALLTACEWFHARLQTWFPISIEP